MSPLVTTALESGVCVITLDDSSTLNALGPAMRDLLMARFETAVEDPEVRAIVVTGADGNFSAGGDLSAVAGQETGERVELLRRFEEFAAGWCQQPKPVLVAVEGNAAGGAVALIAAADYAIAGDSARFTAGWLSIGLAPDVGALWWLTRSMGRKRLWDWLTSGRRMSAGEAVACGLVTGTCEDGHALRTAIDVARSWFALPGPGLLATRRLMADAIQLDLDAFMLRERDEMARLFESEEHHAAVRRFLDRRRRHAH